MRVRFTKMLTPFAFIAMSTLVCSAQGSNQRVSKTPLNVAGQWAISRRGHFGSIALKMNIQQDGYKISGSIQEQEGAEPLHGNLDGDTISFSENRRTHHGPMTFEFHGIVRGDLMKGTIQSPMGDQTWSAKRKTE